MLGVTGDKILISALIVFISFIYGLPNIILSNRLGGNYDPLTIYGNSPIARDESFAYAPFASYIGHGNFFLKEIYVKEYSKYPTPFMGETLPSQIFAFITHFTGSIEKTFIVADFIFPPVIFVLLFIVMRMLTRNNIYAMSTAFLTSISRDFIAVIPFPKATFEYLTLAKNQSYLLFLSRSFHPQTTFIVFVLSFIFFTKVITSPKSKIFILGLGLSFGLLTYCYLFYWSYFLFFYLSTICFFIIKKNSDVLKALLVSGFIYLLISSYYFVNMASFYQLSIARDFVEKSSLENLPFPLTIFRYLLLSFVFLLTFRKKGDRYVIYFLLMITTVIIAVSSKVVIGQDLETLHYLRRVAMPLETLGLFAIIFHFIKKKQKLVYVISLLIFLIAVLSGFRSQIIASNKIEPAHKRDLDQQAALQWLSQNTPQGSVIGSIDVNLNSLIPIYSKNYVYFPPTDRTITPTLEGVTRFAVLCNVLGIDISEQKKMIQDKGILSYMFVYQAYDDNLKLSKDSYGGKAAELQLERAEKIDIQTQINQYNLDYVVVSPDELAKIKPNMKVLQPVTSVNGYLILKVNR